MGVSIKNERHGNFFRYNVIDFDALAHLRYIIFIPQHEYLFYKVSFLLKKNLQKTKKTATFKSQIAATPMTKIRLKSSKYARLQPEICMTYLYTDV